jgi:ubiquinone/menaquinone biosynthesis C-methylase UbiE
MNTQNETVYILGHSPAEIRRLITQAEILRPITKRLLLNSGIGPGMRILDIGCGAGDVAMLAAELVGPSGSVVGIDRNPLVLATARERAQTVDLHNVSFEDASPEALVNRGSVFDLVVGRYVLIHQPDPVTLLRDAGRLVKPGGSIAFHEIRLSQRCVSVPNVPLFELIEKLIRMAFSCALPHYDAGDRLIQHFSNAGLPEPTLFSETPIWGCKEAPYNWLVDTLHSLSSQLQRMGIVLKDTVGADPLEQRLRDALATSRSQVSGPAQICAWARL